MTPEQHKDALRDLRTDKKRLSLALVFTSFSLLLSVLFNILTLGNERTIVTPPVVEKAFWVTSHSMSAEYLEQMGQFIANNILNVSASSIEYQKNVVLRYVPAAEHGDFKIRMEKEADRLKALNASTVFFPQRVTPDDKDFTVRLDGLLETSVNGNKQPARDTSYLVEFTYKGGRLLLKSFQEVPRVQ